MEIILLIFWILWPILCYNLAKDRGHNTSMAIVGGIIFGVFSVLYYLLSPKKRGRCDD